MSKVRKPQGALDWDEKQAMAVLNEQGFIIGLDKIDGVRLILRVDPYSEGKLTLRSRSGKALPALQEFHKALLAEFNPADWQVPVEFEGELTLTDEDGLDLPCKNTSGTLQRKEQVDPSRLRWHLFDAIRDDPQGSSNGYVHRMEYLKENFPQLSALVGSVGVDCVLLHGVNLRSLAEIDDHFHRCLRFGLEGGMYRDPECPPRSGKVLGMWKRKPSQTDDGIIVELYEAKDEEGNPKGMVGSIGVRYEDGTLGKAGAGALTHEERTHYWRHPEEIIGRYCEVKSMEDTGCGGKRHPNFLMFRDAVDNKGEKV